MVANAGDRISTSNGISELGQRWDKCINVLGGIILIKKYFSAIN
jgi:hypothetical protein